jgi:hypothetical protein
MELCQHCHRSFQASGMARHLQYCRGQSDSDTDDEMPALVTCDSDDSDSDNDGPPGRGPALAMLSTHLLHGLRRGRLAPALT